MCLPCLSVLTGSVGEARLKGNDDPGALGACMHTPDLRTRRGARRHDRARDRARQKCAEVASGAAERGGRRTVGRDETALRSSAPSRLLRRERCLSDAYYSVRVQNRNPVSPPHSRRARAAAATAAPNRAAAANRRRPVVCIADHERKRERQKERGEEGESLMRRWKYSTHWMLELPSLI